MFLHLKGEKCKERKPREVSRCGADGKASIYFPTLNKPLSNLGPFALHCVATVKCQRSQRPLELYTGDSDLPENLEEFASWVAIPDFLDVNTIPACFRTFWLKRTIFKMTCPGCQSSCWWLSCYVPGTEPGAQALWGIFIPHLRASGSRHLLSVRSDAWYTSTESGG